MMYYIDIIKRLYPYELMSMSKKESYEFFRNRLLEHYMPGHNGQSMSDAQAIESAGQVLNEMRLLHQDRYEKINPDFEKDDPFYTVSGIRASAPHFYEKNVSRMELGDSGITLGSFDHR